MTPKYLFQQLQTTLRAITFSGGSTKIFGDDVFIVPELPIHQASRLRAPCCFIQDLGANSYDMHDEIQEQNFSITSFTQNFNDAFGEGVVVGANIVGATGQGLLDIEQNIYESLRTITALSSSKITLKSKSRVKFSVLGNNSPCCYRTINYSALVSSDITPFVPDHKEILRSPGYLYWNPTSIPSGTYGTLLGFANRGILIDTGLRSVALDKEDRGSHKTKVIYAGSDAKITCELMNYNSDTIARIFLGMNSTNKVNAPTMKTGKELDALAGVVAFIPDDTTNQMCFVFHKAVPLISNHFIFSRETNTTFTVSFQSLLSASEKIYYFGPTSGYS